MDRADAYAALVAELEQWRLRPQGELALLVGAAPSLRMVHLRGEPVTLEVSVSWVDASRRGFRIEALANGSSHWLTERLSERIVVPKESPE